MNEMQYARTYQPPIPWIAMSPSGRVLAGRIALGAMGLTMPAALPGSASTQKLTPDQIAQALGIAGWKSGGDRFQRGTYKQVVQAIQTLNFVGWVPPRSCSGAVAAPPAVKILNQAGNIALSFGGGASGAFGSGGTAITAAIPGFAPGSFAATAVPIIGAIVVTGLAIFGAILRHHAHAVAVEQQLECAAVPAAQAALTAIRQAVANGTITAAQGVTALEQLVADFVETVGPCMHGGSGPGSCGHPDACCGWTLQLEGIAMALENQFLVMAATGASPAKTSSLLPLLLVGAGAFLFLQ